MTEIADHKLTKILIDWLRYTVGMECLYDDVEDIDKTDRGILARVEDMLGVYGLEWEQGANLYGYRIGWYCGGIRICWGGNDDTVMIDLSGEGCRLLETLRPDMEWYKFIESIQQVRRFNISRLDVACDTFGTLKMSQIIKYTLEYRYVSVYKSIPRIVMGREETVDFGSRQSNVMLRIYNKTLERQQRVTDPDVVIPEGWVRLEFELKNDGCDAFIRSWQSTGNISESYFGLLANQLNFVQKRESNLSRSKVVAWWRKLLGNAKKIPLAYQGGLEYNLQSLRRYVIGQAGSSIRAYIEYHDGDITPLLDAVQTREYNVRQRELLATKQMADHQ